MGSLFGVWFGGSLVKPLRPHLGVARWFHKPVVLGLGVLIGATFNQAVLAQAGQWWLTLTTMIVTTVIVTVIGYQFLRRARGYEPPLALLCSVPGGQAEAIAMAREMVDRDYVVALFHLVRVVIVFVSTPMLLGLIEGQQAVDRSNTALLGDAEHLFAAGNGHSSPLSASVWLAGSWPRMGTRSDAASDRTGWHIDTVPSDGMGRTAARQRIRHTGAACHWRGCRRPAGKGAVQGTSWLSS